MSTDLKKNNQHLQTTESETQAEPDKTEGIQRGQWYWVKETDDTDSDDDTTKGKKYLACVTHVGSNYAELKMPSGSSWDIHFDEFDKVTTRELDHARIIQSNINEHQQNVKVLLDEIKQLSAGLGIMPKLGDGGDGTGTALAVASKTVDLKAHKKALVKAKNKTLPALFEKVEEEHKGMAMWMKAGLIPMKAEMEVLKTQTEGIEDKIFTVELYAGLCEEIVEIKKGEPASNNEKICLFQRRHYMDEECLVDYKAGGMTFKSVMAFDKWLIQKEHLNRILPFPKCIVAFRVRRYDKDRGTPKSFGEFIQFWIEKQEDKITFLYIRNGDRCFRLNTEIDFDEDLFPNKGVLPLTQGKVYIKSFANRIDELISEDEYKSRMADHEEAKAKRKKEEAQYKKDMTAWKKLSKAQKKKKDKPYIMPFFHGQSFDNYEPLTQDSVRYDEAMERIAKIAKDHNRIAIVLQGILDRSESLHPHPPWQLWTDEGFKAAIKLVFDNHGLTSGDPPDFEAFRLKLNRQLKKGSHTIGQEDAWTRAEAVKENNRYRPYARSEHDRDLTHFEPYGNPGPGHIAQVWYLSRDKTKTHFEWHRDRLVHTWRSGEGPIRCQFSCSTDLLLNVDAYKPGDFKQFYSDHRTRAEYLKWAPLLLAAEDFHAKKRKVKT